MPEKSPKVILGLKNLAMLPSYFDYIFVYLKQKAHLRPDLSLRFLTTSGPNPARLTTLVDNMQVVPLKGCRTVKQLVPKSIHRCSSSQKRLLPARRCKYSSQTNTQSLASDSAIELHLLQNLTCAHHYDDSRFSILAQGRSPFHFPALKPL